MKAQLHRQVTGAGELVDAEIVRRVVSGEPELFELLLRRYNQRLFRVARGLVANDEEAEDVLQDGWVRAYQHLAEWRGEATLPTWLARIVTHEAFARWRRGRRFRAFGPEAVESLRAPAAEAPEANHSSSTPRMSRVPSSEKTDTTSAFTTKTAMAAWTKTCSRSPLRTETIPASPPKKM